MLLLLLMHVEMENRNTLCALHITQSVLALPLHSYRAILRWHGSASGSDTIIPLVSIRESFWWLQFISNDWDGADISRLERAVRLRQLLVALGAQLDDEDHHDAGGTIALSLAPGLRQS